MHERDACSRVTSWEDYTLVHGTYKIQPDNQYRCFLLSFKTKNGAYIWTVHTRFCSMSTKKMLHQLQLETQVTHLTLWMRIGFGFVVHSDCWREIQHRNIAFFSLVLSLFFVEMKINTTNNLICNNVVFTGMCTVSRRSISRLIVIPHLERSVPSRHGPSQISFAYFESSLSLYMSSISISWRLASSVGLWVYPEGWRPEAQL